MLEDNREKWLSVEKFGQVMYCELVYEECRSGHEQNIFHAMFIVQSVSVHLHVCMSVCLSSFFFGDLFFLFYMKEFCSQESDKL